MRGNAGGRNCFVEDRHLVNFTGEPIVNSVEPTATANMNVIECIRAVSRRPAFPGSDQRGIIVGSYVGSGSDRGDMLPFVIRE